MNLWAIVADGLPTKWSSKRIEAKAEVATLKKNGVNAVFKKVSLPKGRDNFALWLNSAGATVPYSDVVAESVAEALNVPAADVAPVSDAPAAEAAAQ